MAIWDNNEDDYAPGGGGDNNILSTVVQAVTGGDEDTAGDNGEVNEVWMRVKGIEPAGTDASGQYIYKDRKGNIYHYDDLKKKRGNQLFNLLRTGAADDVAPDSYDNPVTDTGEHGILNDGAVVNNGAVLDSNPYNEPAQEWADTAGDAPPATPTPVRNLMQDPWAGAGGGGRNNIITENNIANFNRVTDTSLVLNNTANRRRNFRYFTSPFEGDGDSKDSTQKLRKDLVNHIENLGYERAYRETLKQVAENVQDNILKKWVGTSTSELVSALKYLYDMRGYMQGTNFGNGDLIPPFNFSGALANYVTRLLVSQKVIGYDLLMLNQYFKAGYKTLYNQLNNTRISELGIRLNLEAALIEQRTFENIKKRGYLDKQKDYLSNSNVLDESVSPNIGERKFTYMIVYNRSGKNLFSTIIFIPITK